MIWQMGLPYPFGRNLAREIRGIKIMPDQKVERSPLPAHAGRRWRVSFTLRSLLVAVTILCVLLGWQIHRARLQHAAVQAIREAGGWVYYDYQDYDPKTCKLNASAIPWEPAWLPAPLNVDFFHNVEAVNMEFHADGVVRRDKSLPPVDISRHLEHLPRLRFLGINSGFVDDDGLRYVGQMKRLEVLLFWDAPDITDAGAAHLGDMPRLRSIGMGNSQVGDRGLAVLARLPRLEGLSMQRNNFTDAGLASLAGHPRLKSVWIGGLQDRPSRITDAGVTHLAKLPALEELDLQHTQVTLAGLAPLEGMALKSLYLNGSQADDLEAAQAKFPNCQISAKKHRTDP